MQLLKGEEEALAFSSFVTESINMIDKQIITDIVSTELEGSDLFLVDVIVRPGNNIVVEVDSIDGVSIDDCVALSRKIEANFDREVEDFELEVGSAGISSPFKIKKQYEKNIDNEVEVLTKKGQKLTGVLSACDDNGFDITVTQMVKPEGAKKKVEVEETLHFLYDEVKYTKYLIRFK